MLVLFAWTPYYGAVFCFGVSMKILHLETGMHLYGGAQQVLYLLSGLEERGVRNVLVCARGSEVAAAAPESCGVIETRMAGDLDLPFIGRLCRIIKKERPDLVHIHSRRGADTLGGLAARWAGAPAVLSRRVDNPETALGVRFKYPLYARVVAISGYIERGLRDAGVRGDKLECVPSAVDHDVFRPRECSRRWLQDELGIASGTPVLAVIAQLIPRKGHAVAIRAMGQIAERFPTATMLLLGQGQLEKALRAQIAEAGLEDRVRLLGFRADVAKILMYVDVLIHPALMEGLGVALLQGASAGVAMVASAVGGIPEVVAHERTGLLVPPDDSDALALAVCRLLEDRELAARLGANAREKVLESYTIDCMVAGNLDVYRSVLGAPRRA